MVRPHEVILGSQKQKLLVRQIKIFHMYMTFGKQLGIEYTGLSGKIIDEVFV